MFKTRIILPIFMLLTACTPLTKNTVNDLTIRVATFNVSMDASNYVGRDAGLLSNEVLKTELRNDNQQIKNIAEIIQRVRPDIILLNEFDYIEDPKDGVEYFIERYLNVPQQPGVNSIDYPYYYLAPVNTGKPSPFDLSGDGKATGTQGDAWGFGYFEGQYAMVVLSRYPIDTKNVRTFQHFKWKDMPNALRPMIPATDKPFYSDQIWAQFPLSSKSHWDVPVMVNNITVHLLASHPTPPVFDGPEDRNGTRNHDEVRFWLDYITPNMADYIYDDQGIYGGLAAESRFIILGDLNASSTEGNSRKEAISALLTSDLVNDSKIPQSQGGHFHRSDNPLSRYHTASWGMRADYVLPSSFGFEVIENGVYWPTKEQETYRLIQDRTASSDHLLVWSVLSFNM